MKINNILTYLFSGVLGFIVPLWIIGQKLEGGVLVIRPGANRY